MSVPDLHFEHTSISFGNTRQHQLHSSNCWLASVLMVVLCVISRLSVLMWSIGARWISPCRPYSRISSLSMKEQNWFRNMLDRMNDVLLSSSDSPTLISNELGLSEKETKRVSKVSWLYEGTLMQNIHFNAMFLSPLLSHLPICQKCEEVHSQLQTEKIVVIRCFNGSIERERHTT